MVLCVQITLYLKVRMDWLSKTLLFIKQELFLSPFGIHTWLGCFWNPYSLKLKRVWSWV